MKTIEELKANGFTCHNLVEVSQPTFLFNEETGEIRYYDALNGLTGDINYPDYQHKIVKTCMFTTPSGQMGLSVEHFNNCNLVAWYPCDDFVNDGVIIPFFRFAILK